jgi:hypothetical protein
MVQLPIIHSEAINLARRLTAKNENDLVRKYCVLLFEVCLYYPYFTFFIDFSLSQLLSTVFVEILCVEESYYGMSIYCSIILV